MSEEPSFIGALARQLFLGHQHCMVCGTLFNPKNGVKTGSHNWDGKEITVCSQKCLDTMFHSHDGSDDSAETEAED